MASTAKITITDPAILEELGDCEVGDQIVLTMTVAKHTPGEATLDLEGPINDAYYSVTEEAPENEEPVDEEEPASPPARKGKPI